MRGYAEPTNPSHQSQAIKAKFAALARFWMNGHVGDGGSGSPRDGTRRDHACREGDGTVKSTICAVLKELDSSNMSATPQGASERLRRGRGPKVLGRS